MIGFSMGDYWALLLEEHVKAIVTFYGLSEAENVTAPAAFLGHFAQHDEFEPVEAVHQLEQHLRALGREVSFSIYPGTQHWFFEEPMPDAGVYIGASNMLISSDSAAVWKVVLKWLAKGIEHKKRNFLSSPSLSGSR